MQTLESVLDYLNKLQGLPAIALVFFSCIVVGYALRLIKAFPNDGIPLAVILLGGLLMLLIADPKTSAMSGRVWAVRNVLIGLVVGFLAWMAHKIVLSRIEDFISAKFNLGNTAFFSKPQTPDTEQKDKTP